VVSQAHSYQWLGSFANPGNGKYREELHGALLAIQNYLLAHQLPQARALLRLDGQYGTGAVIASLSGFSFVTRGKDYTVLDRPELQSRLHLPADGRFSCPESDLVRTLYDCPQVAVGSDGQHYRVVVATHPANEKKSRVGLVRAGVVYELFLTNLPQDAFTPADVLSLYLHRGAFEPSLADEDQEIDPDRWCSHAPCGQQAWQIVCQWVWNLRLELGHALEPATLRTTEFAPAKPEANEEATPAQAGASGYGPSQRALPWKVGRFSGQDFALQADGTLRCPAGASLFPQERRKEAAGSLRIVYEARIADCRCCQLREQCQWHGKAAKHPRRVSVLLHPSRVGSAALFWRDWSRRQHRRACLQLLHRQRVEVQQVAPPQTFEACQPAIGLVPSAPIIASPGKNGWFAMRALPAQVGLPSDSMVSRPPLLLSSACQPFRRLLLPYPAFFSEQRAAGCVPA
jgi:hypothetical protein